jgi:ribosome-binding protein aMBF1 (putative translation factor)
MPSSPRAIKDRCNRRALADQLRDLIRRRQSQYGWCVHAIAQAAGIDDSSLARFLAGERDWTLDTAGRVAEVLGIGLVELRGGPPNVVPKLAPPPPMLFMREGKQNKAGEP